jgi:dephospho-CoA kinase
MNKKIIGIIGEQAGGKGSAVDIIIKEYGGVKITTSNILKKILNDLHLDFSRENCNRLVMSLKNEFGNAVLMEAVAHEAENVDSDYIIIDGIRMHGDTDVFRDMYGDKFCLIYVTADQRIRYERSLKRGEKADESRATFDDFQKNEELETEKKITEIGATADYIIINNSGPEDLEKQVKEVMSKII